VVQAFSAVLTGRYAVALVLLGPPGTRVRSLTDPAAAVLVRAVALVGLGRYAQASALLGDRPDRPELRRLRAQVAIEVGQDRLAEELLRTPDSDLLGEAGRRRVLGQLRLRQGHRSEGEALLREAQSLYAGLDHYGKAVDQAYCCLLLGRAALHDGRVDEALPLVEQGLLDMRARPDHAPGLAEAHALAAEARAGAGEAVAAQEHLRRAREQALLCGSDALDAELVRSTAMVALRLGHADEAASHLRDALRLHERLGARPVADELRQALASLTA
jgi:tetratricopeptide (TPR) repeat protein